MATAQDKFAVILLAMGGPGSLDDIPAFLYNIFSDRAIICLPGGPLLQKPLARMISKLRSKKVKEHYAEIGGSSPLLHWTETQARHIENELAPVFPGVRAYVGMRYLTPYTADAIERAYHDGFRRMLFVPMYPQYCRATTGSSFQSARDALGQHDGVKASFIKDFHADSAYIELMRDYIEANIGTDQNLLFSAHSIPQSFVDDGDPYVEQVKQTASLAAQGREYHLSFQSRTGPVTWVGPDTVAEVTRLAKDEKRELFIVPISFLCDHIETLHEIDIELKEIVGDDAAPRIHRMPMFNDDPRLGHMLADLISRQVLEHG